MAERMTPREMAIAIAQALDAKRGGDVRVLKVDDVTVLTDYFVIASGTSTTHTGALADEVEYQLAQKGEKPLSIEGFDAKNWVLIDYGCVIVHIFVPGTRTFYDLEHLWADGEPVDLSDLITGED